MSGILARVQAKREAGGVVWLTLASADAQPLPDWQPGAHVLLSLANGLQRAYSLCPAAAGCWQLAVLVTRHSRGGGRWIQQQLQTGDTLRVSRPQQAFALPAGEGPLLLLAGGIGITPLLSMALACLQQQRPFRLHYVGREATLAGLEPIRRQRMQCHSALEQAIFRDVDAQWQVAYCGSAAFMAALPGWLDACNVPPLQRHCESFTPPLTSGDRPFWLEIDGNGERIEVAADQTMAEALLAAGYDVAISCGAGVCGSCAIDLLAGEADHRDSYLTPEQKQAQRRVLPCCSRAVSPGLVVDPE